MYTAWHISQALENHQGISGLKGHLHVLAAGNLISLISGGTLDRVHGCGVAVCGREIAF